MADLFATGVQIPNLESGQARDADYAGFIRIFARQGKLYAMDDLGNEIDLSGSGAQEIFLGAPPVLPGYPALVFEEVVIDGQTTYKMQLNDGV